MSKAKGQTRGHCQKCGSVQVVEPSHRLAKHGYSVPNGYFKGVCQGSGELPLQVSRIITDAIIVAMNGLANRQQMHAEALQAGTILPEQAQQLTAWRAREYTYEGHKQVPVMKPWHDATKTEQTEQLKMDIGQAESNARFFRGHAKSMSELAERVHGTALIYRDAEELAAKAARAAKSAPIVGAYRTKIEQKRALEDLSRAFEKITREIKDRYLGTPGRDHGDKGEEMYYAIPFQLNHWRTKHSLLVLGLYPDMRKQVDAIEILVINREEIKARPVIKGAA
jgi:hypothetical protein